MSKVIFALMAVLLTMPTVPWVTPADAAIRFGTGSAVSHRVEELDRRVEEQQRLNNTSSINSPNLELMDNVKMLDVASTQKMTSISSDSGTFKFSSTTEQLVSLNVGDVLVVLASDTNHFPLLRVITGIEPDGAGMTLITRQAAITEVIKRCSLSTTHTFTLSDFQWQDTGPVAAPASARRSRAASRAMALADIELPEWHVSMEGTRVRIDVEFDSVVYDYDGNHGTTSDQVIANGSLIIYPITCRTDIDIELGTMFLPEVKRLELQYDFEVQGRVDYTWGVGISGEKNFPLLKIPLTPIPLVPPPSPPILYIHPYFTLDACVEGKISAKATTAAYATLKAGFIGRWTPACGVEVTPTVSFDVGYDEPALEVTGTVRGTATLGMAGYVNSLAGLKVEAGAYAQAEIDAFRPPTPWWKLSIGLASSGSLAFNGAGMEDAVLELLSIEEFPRIEWEKELWSLESPCTGTLQITTNNAGASIYVDNERVGIGNYSGEVDAGSYLIHYGQLGGMKAPPDTTVTVEYEGTTNVYGEYLPDSGTLSVRTNHAGAPIFVNGQLVAWGNDFTARVNSGQYTIGFGAIDGWYTPPVKTVTVTCGDTAKLTAIYFPEDGSPVNLGDYFTGQFVDCVGWDMLGVAVGSHPWVYARWYIASVPNYDATVNWATENPAYVSYAAAEPIGPGAGDIINAPASPIWLLQGVSFPPEQYYDYMAFGVEFTTLNGSQALYGRPFNWIVPTNEDNQRVVYSGAYPGP